VMRRRTSPGARRLPVGTGNASTNAPILRKEVWRWDVMMEEFMRMNENGRETERPTNAAEERSFH
jgi:hypothetical protein